MKYISVSNFPLLLPSKYMGIKCELNRNSLDLSWIVSKSRILISIKYRYTLIVSNLNAFMSTFIEFNSDFLLKPFGLTGRQNFRN